MPATAGRVRMPANNRVHSSAALQTHGIWQSAIGYDPYAPNKEDKKDSSLPKSSNSEPDAENAYASFQGLLALARITGSNADVDRGACKRCGRVGHLKFQCKNHVKIKDDDQEKDLEAIQLPVLNGLDKLKGGARTNAVESDEEDDSDSSDSDVDSDIERIIAERYGKKVRKGSSSRKKRNSNEDGSDTISDRRKKRGRSKKRSSRKRGSDDSDDSGQTRRKRKKEKRRRARDESSDEDDAHRRRQRKSRRDKRRRRSHRSSDHSDSEESEDSGKRHARKSRRASSSSENNSSDSDDSRSGRGFRRSHKKSRKRHHKDDK